MGGRPEIAYRLAREAMPSLDAEVQAALHSGATRVCDIGAGPNPIVALTDIHGLELEYLALDASTRELAKCPPGYLTVEADIGDRRSVERLVTQRGRFDLVISRWTAEHIRHGKRFHEHVHRLLRPHGIAIHLFPTLYSPVFVANRALPHPIRTSLIAHVDKSGRERGGTHDSFRPYYSWCRGPTSGQLRRVARAGFSVRRYVGFFGHPYYARCRPLECVHGALSRWLVAHPMALLTSYALVVLERDGERCVAASRPRSLAHIHQSQASAAVESSPSAPAPSPDTLPLGIRDGAAPQIVASPAAEGDRHPMSSDPEAPPASYRRS